MKELILNKTTKLSVEAYVSKPTHAVIIEGLTGSGKKTLAEYIASRILGIEVDSPNAYPQFLNIQSKNSAISINEVRRIQQFLKLKTAGNTTIRRILIIENAESMTIEAQNALLKVLEEPPDDTIVMILTNQNIKLLPTIRSRAQSFSLSPPAKEDVFQYYSQQGHSLSAIEQAYLVTGARIGLMSSILNGESTILLTNIDEAKKILSMSKYKRLTYIDEQLKNKEKIAGILEGLMIVSRAALKQTLTKNNVTQAKKWHNAFSLINESSQLLPVNPNLKLLMVNLFLNL